MRLDFPKDVATAKTKTQEPSRGKKNLSADEIRAKIQAHNAPKKAPATKVELSEHVKQKVEIKDTIGDLHNNDPSNPETVGRLKDALSMDLVNFSPKEREVLDQILNK